MASEKSDAIVIRMIEFSETSLIVTLFTRNFGRISAIAKGARRPKGPFEGAIDLLSICQVEVIRKPGDTLDLLTEAKLSRRFRAAQKSLDRLYCGYYVAEMLRRWTDDEDPHQDLYDSVVRTIDQIDGVGDPLMAVAHFEIRAMRLLGNAPGTRFCVSCGCEVNRVNLRIPFCHEAGGVLCHECRLRHRGVSMVKSIVLDWFDRLHDADEQPKTLSADELSLPWSNETYRPLRAFLNRYITITLGSRPRTQSMLPSTTSVR